MRICLVGNCVTSRCLERRRNARYLSASGRKKLLQIASCLSECGHEVTILSASYAARFCLPFREEDEQGFQILHAPTVGLSGHAILKKTLMTLYSLWHVLVRRRYDIVIGYNWQFEFTACALVAKTLCGASAVLDYEDGLFHDRHYRTWFYKRWERHVYRRFDGAILVNEGLSARISEFNSVLPTVIVHGLIDPRRLEQAQKLPTTNDNIRLFYTGNFTRGFGFEELMDYIRHLDPRVRLDITGRASEDETAQLRTEAARHENVTYHGFLDDQAFGELLERANAFLLLNDTDSPYNQTNFPSKFFDYLGRGAVVVTTANPLLAPYMHLPNLVVLNTPAQSADLAVRFQTAVYELPPVQKLREQTRDRLGAFLEELTHPSSGNRPAGDALDFSAFSWTMRPGAPPTLQALARPMHGDEAVLVKSNWRRTVYRVTIDGDSYFLKHTRGDRFTSWVRGMLHCNGRLEFESGQALENAGVPVVPHLAWARNGADSVVVTAAVEPSCDLNECWASARHDFRSHQALIAALATLLKTMARAGVKHRDFHPGNVLVTGCDSNAPKAMLVDVLGVQCGSDSKSAVLDRLRLTVLLRPQLRLGEARMLARASHVGVTQTEAEKTLHAAHLDALDSFRHRWPGIRKRLSRASSVCEERRTDQGRWLLRKPFPLEQAQKALAHHLRNMENETNVVKRDLKRRLSRVRLGDETFIVKEFVCPGPWGPFRPDARSWFAAHRLHTRLVPSAHCLAWLRHADGRGFHILEDVGVKTLMDEMRASTDWQRRRHMLEAAGQIVGLLHAARVDHGDLKPANFVSDQIPPRLRLVDFDGMRFPRSPLLRERRARGFEQLFENLHRHVTPREACRFLLSYATYAGVPTSLARDLLPELPDWGTEMPVSWNNLKSTI